MGYGTCAHSFAPRSRVFRFQSASSYHIVEGTVTPSAVASSATRYCRPKQRKGGPYRMAAVWYSAPQAARNTAGRLQAIGSNKGAPSNGEAPLLVPVAGVEPARVISPKDFESSSSANSNTPACPHIIARDKPKVKKRRKKLYPYARWRSIIGTDPCRRLRNGWTDRRDIRIFFRKRTGIFFYQKKSRGACILRAAAV